jgi:hypothetical protein
MYKDPSSPTARPAGLPSRDWTAGPPSPHAFVAPEHGELCCPAMTCVSPLGVTSRTVPSVNPT